MMKSALIYCRVSGEQDERTASLMSQEGACREEAARKGYTVLRAFHERHSGWELYERKILNDAREMIRSGRAQALVVYETDRLSRSQAHLWILVDELSRVGGELICVTEPFENSSEGRLMLSVRGYLAEVEREKIRERTGRGRQAKVDDGRMVGQGGSKYGYRFLTEIKNGKVTNSGIRRIEEAETAVVRRIFAEVAEGASCRQLAVRLNSDDVCTPGKSLNKKHASPYWTDASVRTIIRERAYTGIEVAGRVKIDPKTKKRVKIPAAQLRYLPNTTPAIVDEAIWTQANLTIDNLRQRIVTNTTRKLVTLRGKVVCGECGYLMPVFYNRHKNRFGVTVESCCMTKKQADLW